MKRLDDLLNKIAAQPTMTHLSTDEHEFYEKIKLLKRLNRGEYLRYMLLYREIKNSQYDE